jgi:hypothetical protein
MRMGEHLYIAVTCISCAVLERNYVAQLWGRGYVRFAPGFAVYGVVEGSRKQTLQKIIKDFNVSPPV